MMLYNLLLTRNTSCIHLEKLDPKKLKKKGQGTFGAALVSTLNIGCAIEDTFIGRPSTSISFVNLNSLVLQDDVNKMNDSLQQARI